MEFYKPTLDEIIRKRRKALTSAEKELLNCCKTGEVAYFGDAVPDEPTDANQIDGALIRYLLLGGCADHPVDPVGVQIMGAYISGELNFHGCEAQSGLMCGTCRFDAELNFMDAVLGHLLLRGSTVPGLNGERAWIKREVFLGAGFKSLSRVNLLDAKIGGTLDCAGGNFQGEGGVALACSRINVGADVFLRDNFKSNGCVELVRGTIGGQLSCRGGEFDGEAENVLNCEAMRVGGDVLFTDGYKAKGNVGFTNAKIDGDLICFDASYEGAVVAQGLSVGREFRWRGIKGKPMLVNLSDAWVGVLADDVESWEAVEKLQLKGFKYGGFDNQVKDFPLKARLEWVGQSYCAEHEQPKAKKAIVVINWDKRRFEPQPYVQLAKVYETSGQREAASQVREVMERRLRHSEFTRKTFASTGSWGDDWYAFVAWMRMPLDWFFGKVFGYGHQPMRGTAFAVLLIVGISAVYGTIYDRGQFAPNSDIVLTSADWRAFADFPNKYPNPAAAWSADKAGTDYESFSAIGYGLDLFLPLDALGQEAAWAPSRDRGTLGKVGFYMRWIVQFLGWVFTGVLAAALTGIIGRKE